jgi:tRNA(Arg) A34 adenosine deaminase TadA
MEISQEVREHFMREKFTALGSPCPRYPFGAVFVNHTATPPKIICKGHNMNNIHNAYLQLHGEMAAITECTEVLGASGGWKDLSLYTNAEACPMVFWDLTTRRAHRLTVTFSVPLPSDGPGLRNTSMEHRSRL